MKRIVFDGGRYYQLISAKNGAPCQTSRLL